jgi:uncharacterized protein (DUF305 family)
VVDAHCPEEFSPFSDRHTDEKLGLACMVHGPGCTVALAKLTPEMRTTCGVPSRKVHCPVPGSSDGDALETLAFSAPMNATASSAAETESNRNRVKPPEPYRIWPVGVGLSLVNVAVAHGVTGPIFFAAMVAFFTLILCSWIHRKSIAALPAAWLFRGSDLVESVLSRRPQLISNCEVPGHAAIVPSHCARVVAVLAIPAALLSSSCHGTVADGNVTHPAQSDEPRISGEPAGHNHHDISFGDSMIAYDQQGTDMSGLVPDRSVNPKVVAFAARSAAALRTDLATLRALIVQWDQGQGSMPGGGQGMAIKGMVDPATFAKLESLRGKGFDSLWLQSMISLDQGAIEISRAELAGGQNVDFIAVARRILDVRQGETGLLKQMLNGTS